LGEALKEFQAWLKETDFQQVKVEFFAMDGGFEGHWGGANIRIGPERGRMCAVAQRGQDFYGISCNHVLTRQNNGGATVKDVNPGGSYAGSFDPGDTTFVPLANDPSSPVDEANANSVDLGIYELLKKPSASTRITYQNYVTSGAAVNVRGRRTASATVDSTEMYCLFTSGVWNGSASISAVYFSKYFSLQFTGSSPLRAGDSGSPVIDGAGKLLGMYCGSTQVQLLDPATGQLTGQAQGIAACCRLDPPVLALLGGATLYS
jgi:hypothetical protein